MWFLTDKRAGWTGAFVVLLVAAALRLIWPGVTAFDIDQSRLSLVALDMARHGTIPRLGMSSSAGVPFFPASVWVYSIPYLLSTDPLIASLFVSVTSLGAIAGVWALARRHWGLWAAWTAALFMAVSPYSVLLARRVWEPDLLPAIAVLWVWTGLAGQEPRRRWAILVHIFLAGFAVQVHFSGAALLLGTAWLFWRGRWWRQIAPVLVGGGLALLAAAPYIVHLANTPHVADQWRALLDRPSQTDLTALREMARLAVGEDWGYLAMGDLETFGSIPLPEIAAGLVIVTGLIVLAREITRRSPVPDQTRLLAELIVIWLVASPLIFIRHSTPVYVHYMLASLPAVALVVGASTRLLPSRLWPWIISGAVVILGVIWGAQLLYSLDHARQVETPGGMGTPLEVMRTLESKLNGDDKPVLVFAHGDDPMIDGDASTFDVLLWDRPHRVIQGETVLILPPYPATLLATLAPFQAWEEIEISGLADDVWTSDRREGAEPFVATEYDGQQNPAGFTPIEPPIQLSDGSQLEGWRVRQVGSRLRISTLWRVLSVPPPAIYQQFHHLHTEDTLGQPPFMVSDVSLSSRNWQAGDRLIVMGDFIPDAPGTFWIEVGHYTWPDIIRAARTDGNGDSVRLGPFDWQPQ